jgi:hypothetical protein
LPVDPKINNVNWRIIGRGRKVLTHGQSEYERMRLRKKSSSVVKSSTWRSGFQVHKSVSDLHRSQSTPGNDQYERRRSFWFAGTTVAIRSTHSLPAQLSTEKVPSRCLKFAMKMDAMK